MICDLVLSRTCLHVCNLLAVLATVGSALSAADEESTPTASVTIAQVQQGQLSRTLTLYGTVTPASGSTRTLALTYDAVIDTWTYPPGATLAAGTVLGQAHLSSEAATARNEALANENAAQDELKSMQARHDLGLVTLSELHQAESAARIASLHATTWRTRCRDEHQDLLMPATGVLLSVTAIAGQVVTAGTSLAIIASGAREARLGLEPADALALPADAPFTVSVSRNAAPLPSIVASLISSVIDPDTRLLTVVLPLAHSAMPIGAPLTATVACPGPTGLLVPRGSLQQGEEPGAWMVFRIDQDIAHRVPVNVLAESGAQAVIESTTLTANDTIAVTGSGVLIDGMHVTVEAPAKASGAP